MTSPSVGYVPGRATATLGDFAWLLMDIPPDGTLAADMWRIVSAGGGPGDMLDALTSFGVGRLPSLVMVASSGDRLWALTRGEGRVIVESSDSQLQLDAIGLTTWAEHNIPDMGLVSLQLALADVESSPANDLLPSQSGVVLAASIELRWVPATPSPAPTAPQAPPLPADVVPDTPPPDANPEATAEWRSSTRAELNAAARATAPLPAETDPLPTSPDENDYDYLFGATSARTVEQAAVREGIDDGPDDFLNVPAAWVAKEEPIPAPTPTPPARPPSVPMPPAVHRPPAPNAPSPVFLISDVPIGESTGTSGPPLPSSPEPAGGRDASTSAAGETRSAYEIRPYERPAPATPAPPDFFASATPEPARIDADPTGPTEERDTADSNDPDAHTVRRSDLPPDAMTPTIMAVRCTDGHLNPPHAARCRICDGVIPAQDAAAVPRPALGVLTTSTGSKVTLDRNVILGRSPTRTAGSDKPHLVKLTNTAGDVSRNHVEVEIEGWHVVVRDLASTNGTFVTLPGREPQMLRPDERLPILPGTKVSLADDVYFRYEAE